jgi:hypothetical protein
VSDPAGTIAALVVAVVEVIRLVRDWKGRRK